MRSNGRGGIPTWLITKLDRYAVGAGAADEEGKDENLKADEMSSEDVGDAKDVTGCGSGM